MVHMVHGMHAATTCTLTDFLTQSLAIWFIAEIKCDDTISDDH